MNMLLNLESPVTTAHRAKLAYIYVRQSTAGQVRQHQESTELQYRLVDRAALFGWPKERIEVIDDDLGKSGASSDSRGGFQRLIAEIGLGKAGHHGCSVSRETLRGWMIAEGLWQDRRHRLPSPHQPRRRRDCLGELVQIDGSEHAWFEDRGPPCTLLAFVDDATSRLMELRFVTSESAFDYFRTTRAYLEAHGKPVAFYSDKHGIFRVNRKDAAGGDGVTQFGRALMALNIDIICANSPQAKGRIERAFGTLQDRMVKELRLAGVSSIAAANLWLPGFTTAYNTRFGRDPANAKDLHRPLAQADDLDEILAWREERTVTRNLTLHYDRMMLLLDPTSPARGLVRQKVEVVNYPDGRFAVQFNGAALGFKVFDKIQTVQPGAIVDNKRLSAVLEQVKAQQAAYPAHQQRGHVARRRPPNNLEAPGLPSKGRAPRHRAAAATA